MAEVHIVGQLVGGTGFTERNLFCKWGIEAGRNWDLLEGFDAGQTQVDQPPEGESAVWAHPVDIHYACKSLTGWPKLWVQVWSQDTHGCNEIAGYGFCHVPTSPGMHEVTIACWVPEGSLGERFQAFFLGGHPRLRVDELVHTPGDRFRLQTRSAGQVHVHLGVVLKNFGVHNIRT